MGTRMRMFTGGAVVATALTAGAAFAQVPEPSLAEAKTAIAAALATADTMKAGLGCVVIDSRGAVITAERMDNALFFTVDVARGKALVSATFGGPSGSLSAMAASGIGVTLPGPASPVWLQGAVPLTRGTTTIGAIGCSGGSGQQDEDGAKAGAATLQ
jgi:glc operon protein GlcG